MALVVTLTAVGCVSAADKTLVATAAAVGDGDLANWDKLTDLQKKTACWKLTRAHHVLDFSLNDAELLPQWQTNVPPWGIAIAPVATAKCGGK
jgi:hypothetical protein